MLPPTKLLQKRRLYPSRPLFQKQNAKIKISESQPREWARSSARSRSPEKKKLSKQVGRVACSSSSANNDCFARFLQLILRVYVEPEWGRGGEEFEGSWPSSRGALPQTAVAARHGVVFVVGHREIVELLSSRAIQNAMDAWRSLRKRCREVANTRWTTVCLRIGAWARNKILAEPKATMHRVSSKQSLTVLPWFFGGWLSINRLACWRNSRQHCVKKTLIIPQPS